MNNVFNTLEERGFIQQVIEKNIIRNLLEKKKICFYIGFDPTMTSLHIGNLVQIMSIIHMQNAGHKSIILIGDGTALIGDPSGKTKMRTILNNEQITYNSEKIMKQLSKFIKINHQTILLNNSKWICSLNYIKFLKEIGIYFSVNKMLSNESCKIRLKKNGLSFLEFNYILLQAFDFLYLENQYDCLLQMGGNDQWGNIIAGINLIKRIKNKKVYAITSPLIITAKGHKMGKTEQGTIWLDQNLTSPYDFYQYWINIDDRDLLKFLALFTFLPMNEIYYLKNNTESSMLNIAKTILAFEVTKLVHGEKIANEIKTSSQLVFGHNKAIIDKSILPSSSIHFDLKTNICNYSGIPKVFKTHEYINKNLLLPQFLIDISLCNSKKEAKRLILQGGISIDGKVFSCINDKINSFLFGSKNRILIRKGKKKFLIVELK